MVVKLSAEEAEKRFNVTIPIEAMPEDLTEQEERNIATVLQYMRTAYSYKLNRGKESVKEFCASSNTFEAPSTFPTAHTAEEYAESHSKVLSSLQDLHIKQFDFLVAKGDFVSLRYSATGSHNGEPHSGIEPTGNRANWSAQGSYIMQEGKIKQWWKDWDKQPMWRQLGWAKPNDFEYL